MNASLMRTARQFVLLFAALVGLMPASAGAHDHTPPSSFLVTDRGEQRGATYVTEWARGDGRFCVVGFGDGIRQFPEPVPMTPGSPLSIRLEKADRPTRVEIDMYPFVNPLTGEPMGEEQELAFRLHRGRHDGRRVWTIELFPQLPSAEVALDVMVQWKDHDGCGSQRTFSTFHARVGV